MSCYVRPALLSDAAAIAALESDCFSLPRLRPQIEREIGNFLVAEADGAFLGYIDAQTVLDEGYIGNIAVIPESRGQGAGRALLRSLIEQHRGVLSFLTLEVRESNLPARRLYESEGFRVVAVRRGMYEKPKEDGILMNYDY